VSRQRPFVFAGGTAVLTGAASGMGEQLAHQLADRGTALVLLDRDAEGLERVRAAVRAAHPDLAVEAHVIDLAETEQIGTLAAQIVRAHPRLDLLVNNAGVALAGRFEQLSLEEFDWVMRINFTAAVALTSHLLPTLLTTPGSHLVNLSSLFGLIAPGGQSAYAASKFALRGFSQALQAELADRVGVTTVYPGGIRTRIAETARVAAKVGAGQAHSGKTAAARLLTYPADRAAAEILDAVQHRRARLLIAANAKVPDLVARLAPAGHVRALSWLLRRDQFR
jgi:short-subunit dehydrogenase